MMRVRVKLAAIALCAITVTACVSPRAAPGGPAFATTPNLSAPLVQAREAQPAEAVVPPAANAFVVQGNAAALAPPRAVRVGAGRYTVNLQDADIAEAARVVFGDLLGVAYTIDPAVHGQVTMNASEPLDRDSLIALFEQAAAQAGASVTREGQGFRLVSSSQTANGSASLLSQAEAGFGVTAIPLKFIGAEAVRAMLEGVLAKPGSLRADSGRNLVFATGSSADRKAAIDAIAAVDVDWMAAMSVGLFPLQNTDPATMIGELETVLQSGPGGIANGALRLRPVTRVNAVLAIASSADLLNRAQDWIGRLDVAAVSATSLRAYFLDNGRAQETARLLSELFGSAPISSVVAPGVDSARAAAEGAAVPPKFAAPAPAPAATGDGAHTPRVIADTLNNALLVLADSEGHRLVQRALAQIDRAPPQVMVDATIAEVTLTDKLRFGVQYFFETAGIRNVATSGRGGFTQGSSLDLKGVYPGFNLLLDAADATRLALDTLSTITNVKVRSSPSLVVMDNQTATLRVGDRVPVVTRQASSVDSAVAPLVNQIEFQDTGVILTVTPRVSSTSVVTLDVDQEVSNVSDTAITGALTPTISQRRITSTVAVRSGQTLVLGGLISDARNDTRAGVPGLSKLPVVGALFSSTSKTNSRTELLVFLTPRVLRTADDMSRASAELRDQMISIQRDSAPPAAPEGPSVTPPPASGK